MGENWLELGAGAVFAIIVIREVLGFWLRARGKNGNSSRRCDVCSEQVKELYQWHNVRDNEGRPVWYVSNKALVLAIEQLSITISKLADGQEKLREAIGNMDGQ